MLAEILNPRMCDRCLAQTGVNCPDEVYFKNFSDSAAWQYTGIDHSTYMRLDSGSLSAWSSMPGFNFEQCTFDSMHTVYLGTGRDICASGILTLIEKNVYPGSNDLDETLADVHRDVRAMCSQHGFPRLQKNHHI